MAGTIRSMTPGAQAPGVGEGDASPAPAAAPVPGRPQGASGLRACLSPGRLPGTAGAGMAGPGMAGHGAGDPIPCGERPGARLLAAAPPAFAPGLEELAVAADACAPAALACALAHAIGRWLAAEAAGPHGVPEGRRREDGPIGAPAAPVSAGSATAMSAGAGTAGAARPEGIHVAGGGTSLARLAETLAAGSEAGGGALARTDMTGAGAAPSVRAGTAGSEALAAALAGIGMASAGSGRAALTGAGLAGPQAPATTVANAPAPGRACLLAAPRAWLAERGLPRPEALAALGLLPPRLLLVATRDGPEALWAAEEALRSGAAGLVIAAGCRPGFAATLRLDHAARAAGARVALLRVAGAGEAADLSVARVRWRIRPAASRPDPWDARAPGRAAWTAEAVRRRDGPPGAWRMEWDDAAHAVRVAGRLADDGLAAGAPAARPGPARRAA